MQHPPKKKKTDSRKKKLFLWLGFALALAAAVALVLLLPAIRSTIPGKTASENQLPPPREQQLLHEEEAAGLACVEISHLDGESYLLSYKEGALYLVEDGRWMDINDTYSDELIQASTYLLVSDKVTDDAAEVEPYLADMGLNPPLAEAKVTLTDGREYTLQVGNTVPGTTYSYYRWSELPGVYMCDSGIRDAFFMTKNRLLPVAQPEFSSTLVDSVILIRDGITTEVLLTSDTAGNTVGSLLQPWQYPMADEYVSALKTTLDNFRLGTLEGEATEENLTLYGFDDPICVLEMHQKPGTRMITDETGALSTLEMPEQTLRFTFGRPEGDYFYTCLYEGNIYLVSRLFVETLIQGGGEEWLSQYPLRLNSAQLGSVILTTQKGSMEIHAQYTERVLPNNELEVDEEGNLVYDIAVTVNGEEWTVDGLDGLADRFYQTKAAGRMSADFAWQDMQPRWTLELTTVYGQTRTVSGYRVDPFTDALVVDGVMLQYVHSEAIQMALGELAEKIIF